LKVDQLLFKYRQEHNKIPRSMYTWARMHERDLIFAVETLYNPLYYQCVCSKLHVDKRAVVSFTKEAQ